MSVVHSGLSWDLHVIRKPVSTPNSQILSHRWQSIRYLEFLSFNITHYVQLQSDLPQRSCLSQAVSFSLQTQELRIVCNPSSSSFLVNSYNKIHELKYIVNNTVYVEFLASRNMLLSVSLKDIYYLTSPSITYKKHQRKQCLQIMLDKFSRLFFLSL